MAKVRPPRKKESLDLAATAAKTLKKSDAPLSLKNLLEKINSLPEVKKTISISNLHNELNFDGRFVFLKGQGWLLKTQVPDLERDEFEDFDLLEEEYQPSKEDYEWDDEDEDEDEDDEELLVPFDEDLEIDIDDLDDDLNEGLDEDLDDELDDELDDVIDELEELDDEVDPIDDLEDFEDFEDFEDRELEEDDEPII
ncbi:MAG: hypothetical protein ACLFPS_02620 [Clostridia bacterium]